MKPLSTKSCLLTIDVEDWYHILDLPSAPDISEWDNMPARVERNFNRLLEILDQMGRSRLAVMVDTDGTPKILFFDENGEISHSIPE